MKKNKIRWISGTIEGQTSRKRRLPIHRMRQYPLGTKARAYEIKSSSQLRLLYRPRYKTRKTH